MADTVKNESTQNLMTHSTLSSTNSESFQFIDWGLIPYEESLMRQLNLVEEVAREQSLGKIIFCTHPPVVTLGRATQPGDVFDWKGEVIEISRGGRATYHGPSQLVVYVICNLQLPRKGRGPKEVVGFLRDFEKSIVTTINEFGVHSIGKSVQENPLNNKKSDETGVWVENKKIASLGLAVKKWVTFHGAAINLKYDPTAFVGLNPCGFSSSTMKSLEELTQKNIDTDMFKKRLLEHLYNNL